MADIIRLTVSEVEGVASKFGDAATQTKELIDSLKNEVEGMASGWEGDAYNAFVNSFGEIATQLNSVVEMYEGLDGQLKKVVEVIQNTDSELAGAMSNG